MNITSLSILLKTTEILGENGESGVWGWMQINRKIMILFFRFREFWEDKFHCKMPTERIKTTNLSTLINPSKTPTTGNETDVTTIATSTTTQIPFCTGNWNIVSKRQTNCFVNSLELALWTYETTSSRISINFCFRGFSTVKGLKKVEFKYSLWKRFRYEKILRQKTFIIVHMCIKTPLSTSNSSSETLFNGFNAKARSWLA